MGHGHLTIHHPNSLLLWPPRYICRAAPTAAIPKGKGFNKNLTKDLRTDDRPLIGFRRRPSTLLPERGFD